MKILFVGRWQDARSMVKCHDNTDYDLQIEMTIVCLIDATVSMLFINVNVIN